MIEKYLKIFSLSNDSSLADIKKAYRRLARQNHPDRFTDGEQKKKQEKIMAEVNEAYKVIITDFKNNKNESKSEQNVIKQTGLGNDYILYKKGLEYFNKYLGSNTEGYKDIMFDLETLIEKKNNIDASKSSFIRLLEEYPESDWAFDSKEKLKKIDKTIANLEERISNIRTQTYPKKDYAFYNHFIRDHIDYTKLYSK